MIKITERADDGTADGGDHAGGDAFAHHIRDDKEIAVISAGDDIIKVTTDGKRALAMAGDADAGDVREPGW